MAGVDPFGTPSTVSALGNRILVWGAGGKITLALALGAELGLPVVELDALFWLPNVG